MLQGRNAEAKWVLVPSRVDLKGSEEADALVDEGVRKDGLRLTTDTPKKKTAEKRPRPQATLQTQDPCPLPARRRVTYNHSISFQ